MHRVCFLQKQLMYIFQSWGDAFTFALQNLWGSFISFVPVLIWALVIFIVGWVVASIIGKAVAQVISALKLDKALENTAFEKAVARAGMKLSIGGFIGGVVKWFIVVVFLMASLQDLHLTAVSDFLSTDVLGYLPHVLIAALVLVIATVIADATGNLVMGSAKAANIHSAGFLGTLARYSIWIFAFLIALDQLGIAGPYMQIMFSGLVAMLAIAGGLAFGLGGKEAAARALDKINKDVHSA